MQPRRVNIIIGEPNVGKSNILEALSLLGGMVYEQTDKFMGSFIRYEEPRQLFYDNQVANTIRIATNTGNVLVGMKPYGKKMVYLFTNKIAQDDFFAKSDLPYNLTQEQIERSLLANFYEGAVKFGFNFVEQASFAYSEISATGEYRIKEGYSSSVLSSTPQVSWPVKPYLFARPSLDKDFGDTYLHPPHGDNLLSVIHSRPELRRKIAQLYKPYGLKPLLRTDDRRFEVVKELDGFIYAYPYRSTSDTFQRLIFHLAAIESNTDSVLLFEEPEAHSFPQYILHLAQNIVESRNNQFFIITHSPYLITEILEEMLLDDELKPELAMFAAYYEDYQTKVNQLTDEDILNVRRDGLDVFFNMRRFVPETDS
jgi:AAA15 family ATPase/GTPase